MRPYERLLHYVKYDTASDGSSETCPSTEKQLVFARVLEQEMKDLGLQNVRLDKNGYLYGTVPGNIEGYNGPVLGFIAHMDVVDDVPSWDIKPRIVENYDGGDILLEGSGAVLSPAEFPELTRCKGKSLMVTDGLTLLGADDKADIAEILTLCEVLLKDKDFQHGPVQVAFTPDEEIGRGADLFDVPGFGADYAYTLDGGAYGELEYENFNAASLNVDIKGKNIHPGSAKDKMKNALTIGMEFEHLLPAQQKPEFTEKYDGFFHLTDMKGDVENAFMHYILRDHDAAKLEQKKADAQAAAAFLNRKYGEGTVTLTIRDSYQNMADQIRPHWHLVDNAMEAMRRTGVEPVTVPIRGGTDGARLSFMGLPCPNLGTGGGNFHGKLEYCCVEEMDLAVDCMKNLVEIYSAR